MHDLPEIGIEAKTNLTFKEQIEKDIEDVFFCLDEFAEIHKIDGVPMTVLIDSNELIEREKKMHQNINGAYLNQTLIYIKVEEFGKRPKIGSQLKLDKKQYLVVDCTEEMGVYAITLEAHKA